MTGNDIVKAIDEWIAEWRAYRHYTGRDSYGTDGVLEHMEDLQIKLHKIIENEKIEQRLQEFEENK